MENTTKNTFAVYFFLKKRGEKKKKKRRENSTKNYLEKEKHPMQNHD